MIRIRNRAAVQMSGAERKRSGFRNGVLFSILAAGAAVLAGITGSGYVTVLAADNVEQNQVMTGDDSLRLTVCGTSVDVDDVDDADIPDSQTDNTGQVYDFKDNKTTGTVTVTKVWDDELTNDEREIPDIKISTKKPSKSTLGYTVTFHGNAENGLLFDNGSDVNDVVINSSGQIVSGNYKIAGGVLFAGWYSDEKYTNRVEVSNDGIPQIALTGDLDLWANEKTFEIKGYKPEAKNNNEFNALIPDTVTSVIFTDEVMPDSVTLIDVDADGDGSVVAWTEENNTVMKVSTQIKGVKVQAAKDSACMFKKRNKIINIDLSGLDTQNVTSMNSMLYKCSGLMSLDLSPLDTQNVTSMTMIFSSCSSLTSLDLSQLDTQKVTDMRDMFKDCSGLISLDLSSFNTQNVTDMGQMFYNCSSLISLDLTPLDTANVTNMSRMFQNCSSLTNLDLTPLYTTKVVGMDFMFFDCGALTNLDLSSFDTAKVKSMTYMFQGCHGLTNLDLSSFVTINVTNMSNMFEYCSKLTNLDLSSFNTTNVTSMDYMFHSCIGLTSLDLTSMNTEKVTNMNHMFWNCNGLINLNLSSFDTRNVTNMSFMFDACGNLIGLDLSGFNTSKVIDMYCMFQSCVSIKTLKTGPSFKFVGTDYDLSGTWQNTAGETFTEGTFPSNVADTYTKVS